MYDYWHCLFLPATKSRMGGQNKITMLMNKKRVRKIQMRRGEERSGGPYFYQIQIKCQKWNARQRPQTSANLRHMQQQHPPRSTQPNNHPTQKRKETVLQEYNTYGDDDVIASVGLVFSIMVFYHSIHYLLPSKFQIGVVGLGRWGNFVFRLLKCTPHEISGDDFWWHQQHYVILPKPVTFWETYIYIYIYKQV